MNPALPKPKLGVKDVGEGNKRKSRVSFATLKSKIGIARKGRAG